MSVADLCRRNPVVARPDESVREVAVRMDRLDVGCAVVVDLANHPIGMVTDRDLTLRVLRRRRNPDTTPVRDVMHEDIVTVREKAPLMRALRWMRRDGIRRVPVIDDTGQLIGILTWDDALQVISREIDKAAAVVRSQAHVGERTA